MIISRKKCGAPQDVFQGLGSWELGVLDPGTAWLVNNCAFGNRLYEVYSR